MQKHLSICSPPHVLPTDQISDGESPPAELAKSGTASHPTPPGATKDATEVSSSKAPLEPNTGGGGDHAMAEADATTTEGQGEETPQAAEDQGENTPLVAEEEGQRDAQSPPRTSPEHDVPLELPAQSPIRDRAGRSPPVPPMIGWPVMEEALASAPISEDHRTLIGAVLQGIQSIDSGLKEAFNGLLTGFKVSHVIPFSRTILILLSLCYLYICSSPRARGGFAKTHPGVKYSGVTNYVQGTISPTMF